jgi:hypothetical protein
MKAYVISAGNETSAHRHENTMLTNFFKTSSRSVISRWFLVTERAISGRSEITTSFILLLDVV